MTIDHVDDNPFIPMLRQKQVVRQEDIGGGDTFQREQVWTRAPIISSKKPNKGDVRPGVNTPRFRCRQEGELELVAFKEARVVKSSRRATAAAKADIIVHREAVQCMRREGGDPADKVAVLGSFELQFGQY
ncbi:uncharacterized protein LOC105438868 [Strongylocentrotus purpuratus]|uniref:Uncharacterized protein n=1 Tax=Strongylocentrotus purpuratus TaxID=7668 RepID=A0A7M7PTR9_STRPU|nr:uncharacterized protein LOC105438868 [Strongylocentrotus purpuratus]